MQITNEQIQRLSDWIDAEHNLFYNYSQRYYKNTSILKIYDRHLKNLHLMLYVLRTNDVYDIYWEIKRFMNYARTEAQ